MMSAEPPAATVRDNDQRQLRPGDGTILHAHQPKIFRHREVAERDMFRLPGARIPDGACQAWIGIEKLDAGRLRL